MALHPPREKMAEKRREEMADKPTVDLETMQADAQGFT